MGYGGGSRMSTDMSSMAFWRSELREFCDERENYISSNRRSAGIDHTKLTFYHNGIRRRLTDVHGHVIDGILA